MIHKLASYYEVLGLTPKSTQKEIKRAYFQLAKQYHPDVNPSPDAAKKFAEINEAYEFLSDPQKIRNILFYYATQKQKQKRQEKRNQNIKRRTQQKSKVSKPQFEEMVSSETIKKDMIRVVKKAVAILSFGSVVFAISYYASVTDPDSVYNLEDYIHGYGIFLACVLVIFLYFLSIVYFEQDNFKKGR
jgi:curved DNA-binding protein CbpA